LNADEKQDLAAKDVALQTRLRLIGVSVLAVGLLAAAFVDGLAGSNDNASSTNNKTYEYQMEVIGGKSNLLATEIREWVGSLWHGRRLAHTLAFLSVGGSLACFFLAHRLNHSPALQGRNRKGG
jgi:hypothetical protein